MVPALFALVAVAIAVEPARVGSVGGADRPASGRRRPPGVLSWQARQPRVRTRRPDTAPATTTENGTEHADHRLPQSLLSAGLPRRAALEGHQRHASDVDADGNPLLYYPGDYNIVVRGHRDIAYRQQVLDRAGRRPAGGDADHAGDARRDAGSARPTWRALVNDAFAEVVATRGRRFAALATLPLNDPARIGPRTGARDDEAAAARRDALQQRQRRGARRQPVLAALRDGQRPGRRPVHPSRTTR